MSYPKTHSDLPSLVGKVICFTKLIETETESDFDEGMMARVIGYTAHTDDDGEEWFNLDVDFSEFENYNRVFMKPNYWDGMGSATLTWEEAGLYPKNKKSTEYLHYGNELFEVMDCKVKVNEKGIDLAVAVAALKAITEWPGDMVDKVAGDPNPREIAQAALDKLS